jgi:hypothetical protein
MADTSNIVKNNNGSNGNFNGVIRPDICDSKPDWPPFLAKKAPKHLLKFLLITAPVLWSILFLISIVPTTPAQQRAISNASLEDLVVPANSSVYRNEPNVPGWLTTHPITSGLGCTSTCRPIELWHQVFQGVSAAPGAGVQWAELEATTRSMIYQNVCMTNGESFNYSFLHRGRLSATVPDVMQFRIGIPLGLPAGSKPADPVGFGIAQVSTTNNGTVTSPPTGSGTINPPAAAGNGWVRYSGAYTYTGATQLVNLGFLAVSSPPGPGAQGNFIDDWQIQLPAYLEFTASSLSNPEGTIAGPGGSTPVNSPAIRVGGTVTAPVTVQVTVTGGTATIGDDYSLTVPFAPGNATSTVTITIPAGTYDGETESSIFLIPFSVNGDAITEPNETVTFNLAITSGPAVIAAVAACGLPIETTTTYTILDDDTPTAADVTVGGRVTSLFGTGIHGARVVMIEPSGAQRITVTNYFGYYSFEDVTAGETYVVSVEAKGYRFEPRVITVYDTIYDLDFVPTP